MSALLTLPGAYQVRLGRAAMERIDTLLRRGAHRRLAAELPRILGPESCRRALCALEEGREVDWVVEDAAEAELG